MMCVGAPTPGRILVIVRDEVVAPTIFEALCALSPQRKPGEGETEGRVAGLGNPVYI